MDPLTKKQHYPFSVGLWDTQHFKLATIIHFTSAFIRLKYITLKKKYYIINIWYMYSSSPFKRSHNPLYQKWIAPLTKCFHHFPLTPPLDAKKKSISSELWQFFTFTWTWQGRKGLLAFFRALTSNPLLKKEVERKGKARTMASDIDCILKQLNMGVGTGQIGHGTQEHLLIFFSPLFFFSLGT